MTIEVAGKSDVLPPGWSWYHARRDFITSWGPRYVTGQGIKLTKEQADELLAKGVLEEGPDIAPLELGRREQEEKPINRKEK